MCLDHERWCPSHESALWCCSLRNATATSWKGSGVACDLFYSD